MYCLRFQARHGAARPDARRAEAADRYIRALAHARDPRLHLQAGTALFNALRVVEAYEHLNEALRCGRDLLTTEQLEEAERKLALLSARLGQVTVDCRANGATVRLGDEPWFTCPSRLALGALALGSVLATTGATLMYFNTVSDRSPEAGSAEVRVAPMVGRERASMLLRMDF